MHTLGPGLVKEIVEIRGEYVPPSIDLYPRNTPEILINLSTPIRGEMHNGRSVVCQGVTIQGSKTHPVRADHPPDCHFLSIRFSPNAYYKTLGIPQYSLTDELLPLDDVISESADGLVEQLRIASTMAERQQVLYPWLQDLFGSEPKTPPLVSDVIMALLDQRPARSVDELAREMGYTRKHLAERFKEETGLTIKEYQKIERLQRVLRAASSQDPVCWAQIAHDHGFYDQSHLIRDVKRYTGFTPTEVVP